MEGGAWRAIIHGVAKSWTRLSNLHLTHLKTCVYVGKHTCVCCLSMKKTAERYSPLSGESVQKGDEIEFFLCAV